MDFRNSPLAIQVTALYEKWGREYFKPEAKREIKLEKSIFEFPFLKKTPTRAESDAIAHDHNPKIIIAGAGMSHGGRIGKHELRYLPDPKTTLLMVGYQAPGSPGRLLAEGKKRIRFNGQEIPVRATVKMLQGWSAHADSDELLRFAESALSKKRPKAIFTALGEPAASRFLAQRIHDSLGARAIVPEKGQVWEITKEAVRAMR